MRVKKFECLSASHQMRRQPVCTPRWEGESWMRSHWSPHTVCARGTGPRKQKRLGMVVRAVRDMRTGRRPKCSGGVLGARFGNLSAFEFQAQAVAAGRWALERRWVLHPHRAACCMSMQRRAGRCCCGSAEVCIPSKAGASDPSGGFAGERAVFWQVEAPKGLEEISLLGRVPESRNLSANAEAGIFTEIPWPRDFSLEFRSKAKFAVLACEAGFCLIRFLLLGFSGFGRLGKRGPKIQNTGVNGYCCQTQQPAVLGTAVGNLHMCPGMGKVPKVTKAWVMLWCFQWRGSCGRWPAPNSHAPRYARDFARVGRSISFGDGSHHRNRPALALLGGRARAALLAHHRRPPALLTLLESQDTQDLTLGGLVVNLGLLGNGRLVGRATVARKVVLAERIDLEKLLIGKVARRPILRRIPTTERRPPRPRREGTASLGSLSGEGAGSDVDGDSRGDSRRGGAVGREEATGRGARRAVWAVGRAVHRDCVV